jgi:MipA family protein
MASVVSNVADARPRWPWAAFAGGLSSVFGALGLTGLIGLAVLVALPMPVRADEKVASPAQDEADGIGGLGLALVSAPSYPGSDERTIKPRLSYVLRWGRVSLSSGGVLASRRGEETTSGLAADVARGERWRASLGLRYESGRSADDHPRLAGVHEIDGHLRVRMLLGWRPSPGWELSLSPSVDASGGGTGTLVDLSLVHQWRNNTLVPRTLHLAVGAGASWASAPYHRAHFGIDANDVQTSGYRLYEPGAGWRDVRLFLNGRVDLDRHWLVYGGAGLSHLMPGPQGSPLVVRPDAWSASIGLGRRFD